MEVLSSPFFQYSTRLNYKVGLHARNNNISKASNHLHMLGFYRACRMRVWDDGKSRKVSFFLWLLLNHNILANSWRANMGLPSECLLYNWGYKETPKHCLGLLEHRCGVEASQQSE